jgi:CRISPR-associated protein Csh1
VIYDILEIFGKKYEEEGEKLILDSYTLKDGLYIRVSDEKCEVFTKKSTKSKNSETVSFLDENGISRTDEMEWFKFRDYCSNMIEVNKAYDAPKKSIHNNNYLTLFMKIEKFLETDFDYIKDKLFDKVTNFASFESENEKLILKSYHDYIFQPSRKADIEKKTQILKALFSNLHDIAKEHSPKEYIRVFFDEDETIYKNESAIYISLKIYNDNKYSKSVEGTVYGLSNYNMGLNGKKPFLEHKTKKLPYPFMIETDTALKIKIFFDWLVSQDYRTDLLDKLFLSKFSDNGQAIIRDFDYLPEIETKKHKITALDKPINVINFVKAGNKDGHKEDFEIKELSHLEQVVNDIFYSGCLINNYYDDVYSKIDERLANLIYMTRGAMINYFKKQRKEEFYQVVEKFGTYFIIEHLRRNNIYKAKESLNLKLSLIKHNGGDIVDINALQNKILGRLKSSDYAKLNEEEFSYLSGQIVKYLLDKSEQYEKNADLLEPFLRTNGAKRLKENIKAIYFKYKHAILLKHMLFNNAVSLVLAYEADDELSYDKDSFLIGVLSNNIFYTSTKTEEN